MLHVADVTKVYRTGLFGRGLHTAVAGVSFDVRRGEIVSLIGESGSGKTTLGRMILRLTQATDGSISFDGDDVARLEGGALRTYYGRVQGVFQDPFSSVSYTHLTLPTN